MKVERGFRRLVMVLSLGVLFVGVSIDAWTVPPRPRVVRVTLADGRHVTLEGDQVTTGRLGLILDFGDPLSLEGRQALAATISDLPSFRSGPPIRPIRTPGPPGIVWDPVQAADIRDATLAYSDGRLSWFWYHAEASTLAIAVVAVLWSGFIAIRWVVRGFTG